ncbi:MAG: hypothetical protein K8U57_07620 [Planctomycetes bacterium]|nr:hypothetical protein [Planctomycetota bacterium]
MVIPSPNSKPVEVLDETGRVIAFVVTAEEMRRLRGEIASLTEQLAIASKQRDHHLRQLEEVLREYFPLLPTPEEMNGPHATSEDIARLIADLEAGEGR